MSKVLNIIFGSYIHLLLFDSIIKNKTIYKFLKPFSIQIEFVLLFYETSI